MADAKGFNNTPPDPSRVIKCKEKGVADHYFYYTSTSAAGFPAAARKQVNDSIEGADDDVTQLQREVDYEYLSCDENPAHVHKYYDFELKNSANGNG